MDMTCTARGTSLCAGAGLCTGPLSAPPVQSSRLPYLCGDCHALYVDAHQLVACLIRHEDDAARILDAHGELVVQLERSRVITRRPEGILCSV
jgi:hypothetical protein